MNLRSLLEIGKEDMIYTAKLSKLLFEYKENDIKSKRTEKLEDLIKVCYYKLKNQWGDKRDISEMNEILDIKIDAIESLEKEYILLSGGNYVETEIENKVLQNEVKQKEVIPSDDRYDLVSMFGFVNGAGITKMITDKNLLKLKPYNSLKRCELCLILTEIDSKVSSAKRRIFNQIKGEFCNG